MHCEGGHAYYACQMFIERFSEVHVAKAKAKVTPETVSLNLYLTHFQGHRDKSESNE